MSVWVLVGSGPSLIQEDIDLARDRARVMVINDNYRRAIWADYLYAADLMWWHNHYDLVNEYFQGELWTQDADAVKLYDRLNYIESIEGVGLSKDPAIIHQGSLSGYQAINLVYHWGAKVILLLGYDMQKTGGQGHWFGDHKGRMNNASSYGQWNHWFQSIDPAEYGIRIVNCSRQTALDNFPRMPIGEALERYSTAD